MLSLFTDSREILVGAGDYVAWLIVIPLVAFAPSLIDGVLIGATRTAVMRNSVFLSTVGFFAAYYGPEDRDDGVKFPHEFQGETEDWEVQDKVRDADRNAGQVVYNHGDTCQPASQELVRDEEGIDADGINESA